MARIRIQLPLDVCLGSAKVSHEEDNLRKRRSTERGVLTASKMCKQIKGISLDWMDWLVENFARDLFC